MTQRRIYQEEYPYFITFRTREGYRFFEDRRMAGLLADIILNAAELKKYDILTYQIMLDHVHLLVHGTDEDVGRKPIAGAETCDSLCGERRSTLLRTGVSQPADTSKNSHPPAMECALPTISDLMYTIKSFYTKQIRSNHDISYSIWHPRFHARIVDTEIYLQAVIKYIKHNPIKAELPNKYQKKPYQYFDEDKICTLFLK